MNGRSFKAKYFYVQLLNFKTKYIMSKIKSILGGAFILTVMSTIPSFAQVEAMPQQEQAQIEVSDRTG
jgi:hypothetical protein